MSKIKLQGNASGTGILTIESPNTNTNRTLSIPDQAGDFVLSTNGDVTLSGDITAVDATLSGGVYVGGTGSANYLDDYEEGTWTPAYSPTTSGTLTHDVQVGSYVKIGKFVYCTFEIRTDAISSLSGSIRLGGLPFTTISGQTHGGLTVGYTNDFVTSRPIGGVPQQASTYFTLTYDVSGTDLQDFPVSYMSSSTNDNYMIGSLWYLVP